MSISFLCYTVRSMETNISNQALEWVTAGAEQATRLNSDFYCKTQDQFQTRLNTMRQLCLQQKITEENTIYLVTAIAGEIGNNSFDHNLGNWPDVPGIFFGYDFSTQKIVVLADRGQGIFATLKNVKPELQTDEQALETAFKEKISGRAPENRGNGLKFVRQNVQEQNMHLTFYSGTAKAELNEKMIIEKTSNSVRGCFAILTF